MSNSAQSSTTTTNLTTSKQQQQQQQTTDKVAASSFREVTNKKEHSICELSSSSPSNSSQLSSYKPIHINVNQLDSTRKSTSPYLKYLSTELNNNTILATTANSTTFETSNTFSSLINMDSNKQSKVAETNNNNNNKPAVSVLNQPGSAVVDLNSTNREESQEQQQQQVIPSYSSIFAPSSYRNSLSSQHQIGQLNNQIGSGRLPLRKQSATGELDVTILNKQNNGSNKLGAFSYSSNKSSGNHQDEDDEVEDNEIDERLPFKSSMTKLRSTNKRISPDYSLRCQSPLTGTGKQNIFSTYTDHRCDKSSSKNPQTKISFNESRPPSFSSCQANYNHHDNLYPNLKSEQVCSKCDCNNCYKKRKLILMDGCQKSADNSSYYVNRKYARTRGLHLALKSIILVLLTLLLLILLVGIILATHYLPQVFDRVLNVSRSFNVTIAG